MGHEPVSARVALHPAAVYPGSIPTIEIAAGDDGRFDFGEQPLDGYVLVAWRDDTPATQLQLDFADPAPHDHIEIPLMPCLRRIHGTIADQAGAPIAGATVREQSYGPTTVADVAGHYDVCATDHGANLHFSAAGHGAVVEYVRTQGDAQHDVTLAPEVTVEGVVRDPDGEPVAGVLVMSLGLAAGAPMSSIVVGSVVSDAAGHYAMSNLGPGLRLAGLSATHGSRWVELEVLPGRRYTRDLRLEPGTRVSGTVIDADGAPLKRATVTWWAPAPNFDLALTGDDGTFVLEGVATAEVVPERTIRVLEHEITGLAQSGKNGLEGLLVQVLPSAMIRGRVVHDGHPVAGATVYVPRGDRTLTRVDGTFALPCKELPGGYLEAFSAPLLAYGLYGTIGSAASCPTGEIEIDLEYGASVAGVVVDEDGNPVAEAYVKVSTVSRNDHEQGATGSDGTFLITRMRGGEPYDVTVYTSGDKLNIYPAARRAKTRFDVKDGRTHVTGLRLQVRREPTAAKP